MTSADSIFNEDDLRQIKARGMNPEKVLSQIETFRKGIPFLKLSRPCTIGDGIRTISDEDVPKLTAQFSEAAASGRVVKFTPASGAASRMFKMPASINNRFKEDSLSAIEAKAKEGDSECGEFIRFAAGLKEFAFFGDLKKAMSGHGLDPVALIAAGRFKEIVRFILTEKGLDYANLPKGLIKFHRYEDACRTPFEEHLVEALAYARDAEKVSRLHFTLSQEHMEIVRSFFETIRNKYERHGARLDISFSVQKTSTDTIAVDMDNRPFRDKKGRLLFRPGGHGALLENLDDLHGDVIFIKNIDNVVPDRLKESTVLYKKALGGLLVSLQKEMFRYIEGLADNDGSEQYINEAFEFAARKLSVIPPVSLARAGRRDKVEFLLSRLNRPLRVCGMVRNEGEPGGGPFWVEQAGGASSLQVVEKSQVDLRCDRQRAILEASTHFNPVDLVCGVRDYLGRPFDLASFTDPDSGFISTKSSDGKKLKALELPGLWNGAMADWNTVFVEVPIITFNPVKTVMDLLRKEHKESFL